MPTEQMYKQPRNRMLLALARERRGYRRGCGKLFALKQNPSVSAFYLLHLTVISIVNVYLIKNYFICNSHKLVGLDRLKHKVILYCLLMMLMI